MIRWNEKWNQAFEKRDPALAAGVLKEVLAVVQATAGVEKAYALLAASTSEAILGNEEEAQRYLNEARRIAPSSDVIFQMTADFLEASGYSYQGRFEQALHALDGMLSRNAKEIKDPQLRDLHEQVQFIRGIALAGLHRFEEAQPLLENAKSFDLIDADKSLLYFNLGVCFFAKGNYRSALGAFEGAKTLGLERNHKAGWHYYVGLAHYYLKDYANAKREFLKTEECIKVGLPGPESPDLYKLLAYSCKGLRQAAEAEMYSKLSTLS